MFIYNLCLDSCKFFGLEDLGAAKLVSYVAIAVFLCLIGFLAKTTINRQILRLVTVLVKRTRNTWDDTMLDQHVFDRLSHLGPGVVFYIGAASFPSATLTQLIERAAMVYIIAATVLFIYSLLNAILSIYERYDVSKQRPIKGYLQAIKVIAFLVAAIFVISILMDKQPKVLLGTLGAFAAVLMLVFKDPILGFVAGIQLAGNNMVQNGDWISMPQARADGDVIDVNLTTVMVQNWDKTITSIPIYQMVSQPFTNWRGMSESGGRRIKRSITLDLNSVCFCDEELLAQLSKIELLKDYLTTKLGEIEKERGTLGLREDDLLNGRRLTNIGTFRAYVAAYLKKNPFIHYDMTFIVRQMAPGEKGLPIEVYVFSKDQAWVNYENIQGDIFDHLLAVVPQFNLRLFQQPTGNDLNQLMKRLDA